MLKSQQIEGFPKNSTNLKVYRKTSAKYWVNWLIWLNHLSYSCEFIESVHMNLLTWLNEWINIFKLYRFMVIESLHFHILPRLNRLIWRESYASLVKTRHASHRLHHNSRKSTWLCRRSQARNTALTILRKAAKLFQNFPQSARSSTVLTSTFCAVMEPEWIPSPMQVRSVYLNWPASVPFARWHVNCQLHVNEVNLRDVFRRCDGSTSGLRSLPVLSAGTRRDP